MWEQTAINAARFRVSGWELNVDCRTEGLQMMTRHDGCCDSASSISVVGESLPDVAESYVRGDELHLVLPQTNEGQSGLEIVLMVVQANRDLLIVESTLSLQTLLLDAYPAIDLNVGGDGAVTTDRVASSLVFARSHRSSPGNEPRTRRPETRVLVDERDQLSIDSSSKNETGLRFFGEFMEKGVIRKVQPWWIWSGMTLSANQLQNAVESLADRPLPLAG